jgi:hypothetical protein
LEDS